jgi:hypothetical protein
MATLGECLLDATHMSIALDRGLVRMSAIFSSLGVYWSFTAPFCTMSQMIYNLLICGYVLELHYSLLYHVSDEMIFDLKLLIK